MQQTRHLDQSRPVWLKVIAGILSAAVAAHLAATALFVGPDNAAKETFEEPLDSYMLPFFQQNWSLFAPTPIRTERSMYVRGWFDDENHTEWVNVTELELKAAIEHNLLPSRAGIATRRLATRIASHHSRINGDEQEVLTGHYHSNAWSRLRERLMEQEDRSSATRISYLLRYDRTMAAYATQFVYAWWGEDAGVKYVQVKTVDQRAPAFANRHGESEPKPREREFGRRPLIEFEGQDRDAFAAAIERFAG
ncbi:hypothetical protein EF847_06295 [Actinobacteria bacterium YIM 96077]|uniref:Uncharacterized protein n=1 Tax=Phytoactinopolyspora halophila TaxID=1981511 RepID=A0A329QI01_9ACTN|nr:DUF5819 family protein [Phytoactinopolyspora halophila]AYY12374.1 hypothetical protein EF847_06295 [Actinobacteria bacterium YIM 96077]RAW12047.1 hypothetical protein DPM12_15370 [Phytoactinopolyspora halophila]